MELAYIWVKKFRNIVEQGFNISSTHLFQYDAERNTLNIDKRPDRIENFFEEQSIANVTAIIGQNASGKTNVLELINYALDGGNTKIASPFFMILCDNDRFIVVRYKVDRIITNVPGKVLADENYGDKKHMDGVFFSNVFDGRRHNFGKSIHDLSGNRLLQNQFGENVLTNLKKDIQQQIFFIKNPEFEYLRTVEQEVNPNLHFDLKPTHVILISPTWSNILARAKAFDKKMADILKREYSDFREFCSLFRKKITDSQSEKSIRWFTAFLLFVDFIINEFAPQVGGEEIGDSEKEARVMRFEEFEKSKKGRSDLDRELDKLNLSVLKEAGINEIHSIITDQIARYIGAEYPRSSQRSRFLTELGHSEYERIEKQNEGTYSNRKVQFKSEFNPNIEFFINRYLDVVTSNSLMYTIDWDGISSGHKAYINLFSRFFSIRNEIVSESLLITLDEGDLYFHPRWQTQYLYKLLKILPVIFPNKRIQLILTTHSSFLISDLTKNHLIFLERINNTTAVLSNSKVIGNTFGGNIGELYLDAFFLHGQLISHFAAEKINHLAQRISEGTPLTESDRTLINSIGEEMIKIQLNKMLHDKGSR